LAKSLKELKKDYQDITISTREAYDKLFPPFGDDRENLDKNYKKAVREKDAKEIARLKPLWESASNAYKQAQTRKNALNLKIKKLEREEKKTETAKEEKKTVLGGYEKALSDLNAAEIDLQGYQGEDKYQKAYIKAQDAYNKAVSSGKTPSTPLPKPKIEIKPVDKGESEETDVETSKIAEELNKEYTKSVTESGRYIAELSEPGRIELARSLNKIYKTKLPENGKYSKELKDLYVDALTDNYTRSLDFNQKISFPEFLVIAANEGTYGGRGGAGGRDDGPYVTIASPSIAKNAINQVFQSELQRDATKEELDKLVPGLIEAQAANPNKVKMVKGVRQTIQGLDAVQWITDKLQKLPEYAQRKEDKTIPSLQLLQETARNNGLTLLPSQVESYKLRLQNGEKIETIQSNIRAIAANAMPDNVKKLMDSGNDLTEIYQPYRQSMAAILEIPFDKIDLSDPTLTNAITDKGNMTLFDFKKSLRKDPRWQYTDNARETVSTGLTQVLKDFGFMG
jgi:hypothetical protein